MNGNEKNPPLPRHPAVWWSRTKIRWPVLVWLAAIAALLAIHRRGPGGGILSGTVEAIYEQAAPLETARLLECRVEVGQRVSAGETLALLDASIFEARMAVELYQLERQFDQAVIRMEADLREAIMRKAAIEAELRMLDHDVQNMSEMVERRLIRKSELIPLRARREALNASRESYPELIQSLETELQRLRLLKKEALERFGAAENMFSGSDGNGGGRDAWRSLRRDEHVLRAVNDGLVAEIFQQPGNVVEAGTPVLKLVVDAPPRIIGFLPEWELPNLNTGQRIYISRAMGGGRVLEGRVTAVAPEVSAREGAGSLARPFSRAVSGRRFLVEIIEENDLIPGESVHLHRATPWWRLLDFRRRHDPETESETT